MALDSAQKADLLFKKVITGKSTSNLAKDYFEELVNSQKFVFSKNILNQDDLIPLTAPILKTAADGTIYKNGQYDIVELIKDLVLEPIPNSTAFYDPTNRLTKIIPFNFGDGSYDYTIKKADGSQIVKGDGNWIFDNDSGVLTFFSGFPIGVSVTSKPRITCYKYIGNVGAGSTETASGGGAIAADVASTINLSATYSGANLIIPPNDGTNLVIDGLSVGVGNVILLKNQTALSENGIYRVIDTTTNFTLEPLSGLLLADGVFVIILKGNTQKLSTWVLDIESLDKNFNSLDSKLEVQEYTMTGTINTNLTDTGITITKKPWGKVTIYVENFLQNVAEDTTADFYFTDPTGVNVRNFSQILVGDKLYFNSSTAGYELLSGDKIKLIYITKS